MNIGIISSTFLPGPHTAGIEIFLFHEATELSKLGHSVSLFTSRTSRGWKDQLPFNLVNYLPGTSLLFQISSPLARAYLEMQLRFFQKTRPSDIWHVHLAYPFGVVALPLSTKLNIPSVLTCHGRDIQRLPEIHYGYRLNSSIDRWVRRTIPCADRIISVSPSVRKELSDIGYPLRRIVDIPYCIDFARLSSQADKQALRKKLELPETVPVIVTVSRNHPKKGYIYLLQALSILNKRGIEFLSICIGKDTEELEADAERLGIGDKCRFVGECRVSFTPPNIVLPPEKVIEYYHAADLFVLPSLIETFGIVLIEAMAAGLPVLTSDVDGCRDVVRDDINGLLAPPKDAVSLAEKIEFILSNKGLQERLVSAGREFASNLSRQKIVKEYEELFESLVQDND